MMFIVRRQKLENFVRYFDDFKILKVLLDKLHG